MRISVSDLHAKVADALVRAGAGPKQAAVVAATIVACQRDGSLSHGLQRLPGFRSSIASGWLNGRSVPAITPVSPVMVLVDGDNGFAQVALEAAGGSLVQAARQHGVGMAAIRNIHHFGALWPDVEPFGHDGLIALTLVSSRSQITAWGGHAKIFGTNPIAFACPTGNADPFVFDMASSIMSQGDVLLARRAGRTLPEGVGVDVKGEPTVDPAAVLDGGALLPFGGPKGSALAFMVEILAAALSGAELGFEEQSRARGETTSRSGQFVLVVDPARTAGDGFGARVAGLIEAIRESGATRLPSAHRYERRARAEREGIWLDEVQASFLGSAD